MYSALFGHKTYIRPTALRINHNYVLVYQTWIWAVLTCKLPSLAQNKIFYCPGFLPVLLLTIFNCSVIRGLRHLKGRIARRNRNIDKGDSINHKCTKPSNSYSLTSGLSTDKIKQRLCHQKLDANHSMILIFTIIMFIMFHSPRVLICIYEAITIQNVLTCMGKQKGYYTIWYLYTQNTLQLVQASANHLLQKVALLNVCR